MQLSLKVKRSRAILTPANSPPKISYLAGQASVTPNHVFSRGSAARSDGSVVLVGATNGAWNEATTGINDLAAVALDEDGLELWRYQVCGHKCLTRC